MTDKIPMAVRKLTLSGRAGRLESDMAPWNLHTPLVMNKNCPIVSVDKQQWESDDELSDDDSVDSNGSLVTVIDSVEELVPMITPGSVPTCSPSPVANLACRTASSDLALQDTPTEERSKKRKPPDDCHVLILWSELHNLVTQNMSCSKCGSAVTKFDRRTIGIATELDFRCTTCKTDATGHALKSNYVLEHREGNNNSSFLRRERRIDSYEINWRLISATQLLGESQVGGSIIGLMLDLSREAFRNAFSPMEAALGLEQVKIGGRVADMNLKKETMGKVALFCGGVAQYPSRCCTTWAGKRQPKATIPFLVRG
jgi:hypothetical protein